MSAPARPAAGIFVGSATLAIVIVGLPEGESRPVSTIGAPLLMVEPVLLIP